ncbi:hypothetical protein [Sulfitobacter sp. PS-8MA]
MPQAEQIARTWLEAEKKETPSLATTINAVLQSPTSMKRLAGVIKTL